MFDILKSDGDSYSKITCTRKHDTVDSNSIINCKMKWLFHYSQPLPLSLASLPLHLQLASTLNISLLEEQSSQHRPRGKSNEAVK